MPSTRNCRLKLYASIITGVIGIYHNRHCHISHIQKTWRYNNERYLLNNLRKMMVYIGLSLSRILWWSLAKVIAGGVERCIRSSTDTRYVYVMLFSSEVTVLTQYSVLSWLLQYADLNARLRSLAALLSKRTLWIRQFIKIGWFKGVLRIGLSSYWLITYFSLPAWVVGSSSAKHRDDCLASAEL